MLELNRRICLLEHRQAAQLRLYLLHLADMPDGVFYPIRRPVL